MAAEVAREEQNRGSGESRGARGLRFRGFFWGGGGGVLPVWGFRGLGFRV